MLGSLVFLFGLGLLSVVLYPVTGQPAVQQQTLYYWGCIGMGSTAFLTTLGKRRQLKLGWTDLWVLMFSAYCWVRAEWSLWQDSSWSCVVVIMGVAFFCFRFLLAQGRGSERILCFLFVTLGLVEALWGLAQVYGHSESNHYLFMLTGSFFNPGPFAGYLAIVLPMALHLSLNLPRSWNIPDSLRLHSLRNTPVVFLKNGQRFGEAFPFLLFLCTLGSVACILVVLPATMSRSAWMGALTGSAWVLSVHYQWFVKIRKGYASHRKRLVVGMISLMLLCAILFVGIYFLKKPSADGRLLVWKITTHIIAEHPLFGVSPGHFSGVFGEAQAQYFASGRGREYEARVAGAPEYAFNEYLQIGAELGLIGLGLFLLMVSSPFVRGGLQGGKDIRERSTQKEFVWDQLQIQPGVIGSLVSLLVFACSSYPLNLLPFCMALVFLLALAASANQEHACGEPLSKLPIAFILRWGQCVALAIMTILAVLVVKNRLPIWKAYNEWQSVRVFSLQKEDIETYQKLYPLLSDQPGFLFEYGKGLAEMGELRASNEIYLQALRFRGDQMFCNLLGKNYQALCQYDRSEYWLTKSSYMVPNLLYPHYLLAKMYRASGQPRKALAKARYVLRTKPKVVSTATKEMKTEMQQLIHEILK